MIKWKRGTLSISSHLTENHGGRYHIAKLRGAKLRGAKLILEDLGIQETIHWSQKRISFYHTLLAFSIYHPIPNYEDKIFLKL